MLTISKLATRAEVTTDAIRHYEREGLVVAAARTAAGYRQYDGDAVRRLRFIKQAQQCGFSLTEISELLALKNSDAACCNDVRTVAIGKKLQLEHKIRALQLMSRALTELITICNDEARPLDECPILAALETSMAKKMTEEDNG